MYVGSSSDIRGRLLNHHNGNGAPLLFLYANAYTYFLVEHMPGLGGHLGLALRESDLINEYRPLLNTQGMGGGTSPDLLGGLLRSLGLL